MADADMDAEDGADLASLKQRNQDLQRALLEAQHNADTRLIAAELRAEAQRSGMVDLDGLKLLRDPGAVVIENGEVKGAREALALLRQEKPWLFGEKSSSSIAAAPATARPQAKLATEMTLEEWRRARAELIKRR